jgi:hypothetical protein
MNLPITDLPDDFEGCPPAGLYRCSDAVYRRIRAVSASRLKLCRESYAAFRRNEPREDSESMRFGRAIDCYALKGPEAFQRMYVVSPSIKLTSNEARAEYATWANDLLGDSILSPSMSAPVLRESLVAAIQARGGDVVEADWLPTIKAMREAIAANPNAEHHLTGPGEAHVVMVWTDPVTGIPCKAQADRIQERKGGGVWISDLKSIADMGYAKPWSDTERWFKVERYADDYQLAIQAVHYEQGWRSVAKVLGIDPRVAMTFVLVERCKPYRCLWSTLSQDSMARAENQVRTWLAGVAGCVATGVWPEATTELVVLEV